LLYIQTYLHGVIPETIKCFRFEKVDKFEVIFGADYFTFKMMHFREWRVLYVIQCDE